MDVAAFVGVAPRGRRGCRSRTRRLADGVPSDPGPVGGGAGRQLGRLRRALRRVRGAGAAAARRVDLLRPGRPAGLRGAHRRRRRAGGSRRRRPPGCATVRTRWPVDRPVRRRAAARLRARNEGALGRPARAHARLVGTRRSRCRGSEPARAGAGGVGPAGPGDRWCGCAAQPASRRCAGSRACAAGPARAASRPTGWRRWTAPCRSRSAEVEEVLAELTRGRRPRLRAGFERHRPRASTRPTRGGSRVSDQRRVAAGRGAADGRRSWSPTCLAAGRCRVRRSRRRARTAWSLAHPRRRVRRRPRRRRRRHRRPRCAAAARPRWRRVVVPDLYSPAPAPATEPVDEPASFAGPDVRPVRRAARRRSRRRRRPAELDRAAPRPDDAGRARARSSRWQQQLVPTAERLGLVALLDVPPGLRPRQVLRWRARFDSSWAAAYHPWLRVPARPRPSAPSWTCPRPRPPRGSSPAASSRRRAAGSGQRARRRRRRRRECGSTSAPRRAAPQRRRRLPPRAPTASCSYRRAHAVAPTASYRQLTVRRLLHAHRAGRRPPAPVDGVRAQRRAAAGRAAPTVDAPARRPVRPRRASPGATPEESWFVRCHERRRPRTGRPGQLWSRSGWRRPSRPSTSSCGSSLTTAAASRPPRPCRPGWGSMARDDRLATNFRFRVTPRHAVGGGPPATRSATAASRSAPASTSRWTWPSTSRAAATTASCSGPGAPKVTRITLERGMLHPVDGTVNTELWRWFQDVRRRRAAAAPLRRHRRGARRRRRRRSPRGRSPGACRRSSSARSSTPRPARWPSRSCRSPTRACGWRWADGVQEGRPCRRSRRNRRAPQPVGDTDRGADQPGVAAAADREHRRRRQGRRPARRRSTRARRRRCSLRPGLRHRRRGHDRGPGRRPRPAPASSSGSCCRKEDSAKACRPGCSSPTATLRPSSAS